MRRLALMACGLVALSGGCVAGAPAGEAVRSTVIVREVVPGEAGRTFCEWRGEGDLAIVETRHLSLAAIRFGGMPQRLGGYRVRVVGYDRLRGGYILERAP